MKTLTPHRSMNALISREQFETNIREFNGNLGKFKNTMAAVMSSSRDLRIEVLKSKSNKRKLASRRLNVSKVVSHHTNLNIITLVQLAAAQQRHFIRHI